MTEKQIHYALSKQLGSMQAISTDYGEIKLDDEMRQAVDKVLRPILNDYLANKNFT